jgi:hypothetical protein
MKIRVRIEGTPQAKREAQAWRRTLGTNSGDRSRWAAWHLQEFGRAVASGQAPGVVKFDPSDLWAWEYHAGVWFVFRTLLVNAGEVEVIIVRITNRNPILDPN